MKLSLQIDHAQRMPSLAERFAVMRYRVGLGTVRFVEVFAFGRHFLLEVVVGEVRSTDELRPWVA